MIKETFILLIAPYTENTEISNGLWNEIKLSYLKKGRHYHTLVHIENILHELITVKSEIANWETILFSIYYHDIVYNCLKNNNEEKSAALAEKRMKSLSISTQVIENCKAQILCTKKHLKSTDNDTNFFIDADLSILGQGWGQYLNYTKQIRKEYAIYPDIIYIAGRKKVLQHFLEMPKIFKTTFFCKKYEEQAKLNMQMELAQL